MVIISDGSLECDEHVWSEFGNLICSMHLFWLTAVANFKFISKKDMYSFTLM